VEKADIETFVITKYNRTQKMLYTLWCSATVVVGCVWIDCDW